MKILIAVPCMDTVHTAFFTSYNRMRKVGETCLATCQNSLIYDARNRLGKAALDCGADRILWLDSDMTLPADLMERLSADIDGGRDFVSALYFTRALPSKPVVYSDIRYDVSEHQANVSVEPISAWSEDVFEIAGSGFGAVMMTTDLYRRMREAYGMPFSPVVGLGEDLTFCHRARQIGAKLYCDGRVRPGHVGVMTFDERMYGGMAT